MEPTPSMMTRNPADAGDVIDLNQGLPGTTLFVSRHFALASGNVQKQNSSLQGAIPMRKKAA
jgi:hypothetical protein